jgi:hypothetical protein
MNRDSHQRSSSLLTLFVELILAALRVAAAVGTVTFLASLALACGSIPTLPVKANVAAPGGRNDDRSKNETDKGNAKTTGSNSPAQSGPGPNFNNQNGPQFNNTGSGTQNNYPPAPDRCAGYKIRSDGAFNHCIDDCNREKDAGIGRTGDKGSGAAGVRNAHRGCTDGCHGNKHDAERANCWGK